MKRFLLAIVCVLGFFVLGILVINVGIYLLTIQFIYKDIAQIPQTEAVLVPGAALLKSGAPAAIFVDRVDMAIKLYKSEKVSKILVSGDNSTISHNEVNPVRLYLLDQGIPDKDIFLDHAGFDTYSTMYRARDIFGVSSVIISTQSFHLPRAVFIARQLGLQAYGADADVGHILFRNTAREVLADEKAVLDLLLRRKPKYLGEKIPISGDSQPR